MNVLDENIPEDQRQLLRSWRIRAYQIGREIGRQGLKDEQQIIPLLLELRRPAHGSLLSWQWTDVTKCDAHHRIQHD